MTRVLVTGGAGFIGTNLSLHLAELGLDVVAVDNLSRPGVENNVEALVDRGVNFAQVDLVGGDIDTYVHRADAIFHLAGQTTVTESVVDPRTDFQANALGTLRLLEAARASSRNPFFLYASTNKVYGHITEPRPVGEDQPLDFRSPYGCSKGVADQYTLDYTRTYGLQATVFRNSCIYGEYQRAIEGQGWIAWFVTQTIRGRPITICGDGEQKRDILHIDDWCRAATVALENPDLVVGEAFNIGGGDKYAITLREAIVAIETITGRDIDLEYRPARTADQPYYVSDTSKFEALTGWQAEVTPTIGIARLVAWTHGQSEAPALAFQEQ